MLTKYITKKYAFLPDSALSPSKFQKKKYPRPMKQNNFSLFIEEDAAD